MENITGLRIKECRNDLKLTQSQLGDMVHVTKQSVSKWEKGTNIPEPPILKQLSSLFQCSVDYLLGKTDVKNNLDLNGMDLFAGNGKTKEFFDKFIKTFGKSNLTENDLNAINDFSIIMEDKLKEANLYDENMTYDEKVSLANKVLDILKIIQNK